MAATASLDADTEYLTRQAMFTGYQYFSLFTPTIYAAIVITRRSRQAFSINNALRATWVGGLAGSACVGSLTYARFKYATGDTVRAKRIANAYDTSRIRADDHATIGAVLAAVLVPAILWKRAHPVNLILGGAGVGSAIGMVTHHCRSLSGDSPPKVQVPVN